ncbi:hypothetical protein BG006_002355, partial [Podila minutissima]
FASCKELRVAQTGTHISVWAENGSNDILYQQFDLNMTKQLTPEVPLITREQGGGALLLNEDFTSFTSHICVADSYGNALAPSTVLLCSSSPTDLTVKGKPLSVSPAGVPVPTDSRGNLTVIHRVDDIASIVLTIMDAPGEPSVLGKTYTLNPAKKLQEGLAKVTDRASLKSVTLPDGSKLLDGSLATADMIENAGQAIGQFHKHMQSLPRDGSLQSASRNCVFAKNALVEASSDDKPWDFWHWLVHGAEPIVEWTVTVADDAAHWMFKTATDTFTVTHILKAISWVLQQVVKDIKKIIQWVGFLFEWEDILSTHNSFVDVVNDILDQAPVGFAKVEENVEGWFDQLNQTLKKYVNPKDKYMTQSFDPTSASQIKAETGLTNAAINTQGSNWSNYQLEHGGLRESLAAANMSASDEKDSDDPLSQIWKEIVEPAYENMKGDLSTFWNDLVHNFNYFKSFSLANVFTTAGIDLAVTMIDALKQITITKGKDLTIVDAISLLVALPTTVICKILTGKNPTSELPATSMPKNDTATTDEYPERTVGGAAANSIDRVANQAAKMFSNSILFTEGTMDEVLIPAALIATGIKYNTQVLKLAFPETDCVGFHGP